MEETELYVMPEIYCCPVVPEGVLCGSGDKNVEDPDENDIIDW